MTENKPIIIDGVDVSECIHYQYDICGATKDNYGDCVSYCKDYDMKNCYFKQLTRKTQECEDLKEKLEKQKDYIINYKLFSMEKYDQLKAENEKLNKIIENEYCNGLDEYKICRTLQFVTYERDQAEQKLERIREIAKECKKDICNNCGWRNTDSCNPIDYTCGEFIKILQIIDEVE